jgi:hypothetical protein
MTQRWTSKPPLLIEAHLKPCLHISASTRPCLPFFSTHSTIPASPLPTEPHPTTTSSVAQYGTRSTTAPTESRQGRLRRRWWLQLLRRPHREVGKRSRPLHTSRQRLPGTEAEYVAPPPAMLSLNFLRANLLPCLHKGPGRMSLRP